MQLKCVSICVWAASSYVGLIWYGREPWVVGLLTISLGLSIAAVGFNVQHDGSHGAASEWRVVNRVWATTLDVIGGSSYFWRLKHNTLHHAFVNVEGVDNDLDVGRLIRLAPGQQLLWFHKYQHIYGWFLYPWIGIKWHLYDDWKRLLSGKIGPIVIRGPRKWDLAHLIVFKSLSYIAAFAVPIAVHGWLAASIGYVATLLIAGFTLSMVFQLAHAVVGASFVGSDRSSRCWGRHQVESTINFASDMGVVTFLIGGLNYQIEHHLFPRVCHVHYPRIARIVRRLCEKHGVKYRSFPGVAQAVRLHYEHLLALGGGDQTIPGERCAKVASK